MSDITRSAPELPLPPRGLMFMGEDHARMLKNGSDLMDMPTRLGLYDPNTSVVDLGCGYGRLAYAVMNKGQRAPYLGVDILPRQIDWLQTNLTPVLPAGSGFVHLDVRNDRYNPTGKMAAIEARLPRPDWSPGLVLLFSVFTHMYPDEVRHYLGRLAELLPDRAAAYMTMFLMNRDSRKLQKAGNSAFDFAHPVSDVGFSTHSEEPLKAIAFDEGWVHAALLDNGLRADRILYGSWCGRAGVEVYQDTLVVRRA